MSQNCITYHCRYLVRTSDAHNCIHSVDSVGGVRKQSKDPGSRLNAECHLSFPLLSLSVIHRSSLLELTLSCKLLTFCHHYLMYSKLLCNISITEIIISGIRLKFEFS
jgi:hypothetical protein